MLIVASSVNHVLQMVNVSIAKVDGEEMGDRKIP